LARPQFLDQLKQDLSDAEQGKVLPKFILLGGGGNDIVEPVTEPVLTPLFGILKSGATTAEDAIDKDALRRFLLQMLEHYEKILDVLCAAAPDAPIFIHAYDHPIPDGREFVGDIGPWLWGPFKEAKLTNLAVNIDVMRILIDALNTGVKMLAEAQQKRNRKVHHLRLTGVLESQPGYGNPKTNGDLRYQAYWHDEFHPKAKGCNALAAEVVRQLLAAGVDKPVS
jgi:lysophospholipase L1-like esterase